MATYDSIQSYIISGTTTNSVTFSSISGYTDLILVIMAKCDSNGAYPYLQFNGDTGNNYESWFMSATGSLGSGGYTTVNELYLSNNIGGVRDSNFNWGSITNISNYSTTDRRKNILTQAGVFNGSIGTAEVSTGRWNNSSAITSIKVALAGTSKWTAGSTICLYGILAA